MSRAKTTRRPSGEATEPTPATAAEVKPIRHPGKAPAEGQCGQTTTAAAWTTAHPKSIPILDAPETGTPRPQRQTKAALLRARLAEPGGVSLAALMAATGWQAHTLRAALSGLRKEGLTLTRRRAGEDTIYAIAPGGVATGEGAAPETVTGEGKAAMCDAAEDHPASPAPATDAPGDTHVVAGLQAPSDASTALPSGGTAA